MPPSSASARYVRFLAFATAVVTALVAAGYQPTRHLAGPGGINGMVAGCAIGLVSAALAGAFLAAIRADTPQARMQRGVVAMIVRLVVVIVLGVAAVLSGKFALSPLLLWMAITYMALLPIEVRLAIL